MSASERPAPATGVGLSENVAATAPLGVQNSVELASVTALPMRWAQALIGRAGGPFPLYGSREWRELADEDPRKVAGCVAAAEAERTRNFRADIFDFTRNRRAREIAEARRPRPGDHQGGPVPWDREVGDV